MFVSNTAGFVDAGWDGHLTLELSNVANLPIAIYPGMKIGQISFLRMTTPAEEPYGSEAAASKYHGQRGPTPSRYYLNFPRTSDRAHDDDGPAISPQLLKRGMIFAADGTQLGTTDRVLENEKEHIFDGIVMRSADGERFVGAPEVGRITETSVTLTIDTEEAVELPRYEPGAPEYKANPKAGRLGRFFGGGWKRH